MSLTILIHLSAYLYELYLYTNKTSILTIQFGLIRIHTFFAKKRQITGYDIELHITANICYAIYHIFCSTVG